MPRLPGLRGTIAGPLVAALVWTRERLGVAVFVENHVTGRVLQAASATDCL
jgi:hypothetical protein